jgi:nitroimidazol reductase NimA-like FMN-containing flavoprotein (pyridoxamine 5'-phosphate oxidase superfamily)
MDDETVVEELDRDECLRLLQSQSVGRLAVAEPGTAPDVVPVNYTMLRDSVVFRTDRGTKLRLLVTEPVSFQVDFVDPFHRTGWSVLVKGLAYEASDWEMEVEGVLVEPFAPGRRPHWVRITPASITGRRLVLPAPMPLDPRGYL